MTKLYPKLDPDDCCEDRTKKSLIIAYILWFTGGIFGLHHFYLGRDIHGFLTLATCGGYFTLCLIRDSWRLPEYVRDANNDPDFIKNLKQQMASQKSPQSSWARQCAFMTIGNLFALLVPYATPKDLMDEKVYIILQYLFVPMGSAVGVWLVGNIGRFEGSLRSPLLAAYLSIIPSRFLNLPPETLTTLFALIAFNWYSKKWRTKPAKKRSVIIRVLIITISLVIYMAFWSSWLYYNCTIENDSNTKEIISCREALINFYQSPAFANLSQAIWMLVEHVRHNGFINLWREFIDEFDLSGRSNALATLGLDSDASTQDIIAQYKKLSRQYHPDKEIDEMKKAEKQEKFIQVQTAYKKLVPTSNQRFSSSPSSKTTTTTSRQDHQRVEL